MNFIPCCILKNWNILLFYCKRNGIPFSTHFARPIVRYVLVWWWLVVAETCSLVMNWLYYITFLVYWVVFRRWYIYKINITTQWGGLYKKNLSIILGIDQLDTQLLYFTISLLWPSTCFEHFMLIIRRMNCIDAASGIVTLSKWPSGEPESHLLGVTIPDAASIQFILLMMSIIMLETYRGS